MDGESINLSFLLITDPNLIIILIFISKSKNYKENGEVGMSKIEGEQNIWPGVSMGFFL